MLWLWIGCLSKPMDIPPPLLDLTPVQQSIDWENVGMESVELLQEYIRIDTTNPDGNETRGAEFIGHLLDREGISYEIHESSPGRGNLIARLPAQGEPKQGPFIRWST